MWSTAARVIGYLLLLASGFFYLVSGLVVPFPYLLALWALWFAIVGIAIAKREDWRVVLATPFIAATLWFTILWVGGEFLGWRA